MKRAWSSLVLFLLILAACGTDPPTTDQWCFRFSFAYDTYNFSQPLGTWLAGYGFVPDESGDLSIGYLHNLTVQADQVILHIARVSTEAVADIDVTASAEVFGLGSGTIEQTFPSLLNEIDLSYTPEHAGAIGNAVNITAHQDHTDLPLALQYLEIRGRNVSPFGSSNCTGTPTPSPIPSIEPSATNSPVPTASPSPTQTPSQTPSWSPTPSDTPTNTSTPSNWECLVDFTQTSGGFVVPTDQGIWTSGVGWEATVLDSGGSPHRWYTILSLSRDFGGAIAMASASFNITKSVGTIDVAQTERIFRDADTDTFGRWMVSRDAAITTTPFSYVGSFTANTILGVTLMSGFTTSSSPSGSVTVTSGFFTGYGSSAPFPSCYSATATPTPVLSPTPTPTNTLNLTLTATMLPRTLGTPVTSTSSPMPSATRVPIGFPSTYTPPPLGTLPPGPTSTATNLTGTPDLSGTPVTGTPNAGDIPNWVGGEGGAIIGAASNAMQQALSWTGEISVAWSNIISAWNTTPPQPIPNLPHCATDRLVSEVCAIYYILTYTLFAGPVGSLIIPLGTVVFGLTIVFTFLKRGRAIIVRIGELIRS